VSDRARGCEFGAVGGPLLSSSPRWYSVPPASARSWRYLVKFW